MKSNNNLKIQDALYGEILICSEIQDLIKCPLVQRLRQIRLSNIDSICMPGIANLSRYEHSIGVAYLASKVKFFNQISPQERLILQSAGLLHDTAITPFGHLAEEAINYTQKSYKHEAKWSLLFESQETPELGGIDLQIYHGRQSGLRHWANKNFRVDANDVLSEIFNALMGQGKFGQCIAGDIDLDNLDNVTRIAYHMGLEVDRKLPLRIANGMESINNNFVPVFSDSCVESIIEWLDLRQEVYNKLMLSLDDFCGKIMLIYSSVLAFERDYLSDIDWSLTDDRYIQRLIDCGDKEISETATRWLLSDLWSLSDLFWFEGQPPNFKQTNAFANEFSKNLGRTCFAYRIKDKRTRKLSIHLASGEELNLGTAASKWLFGVASPIRKEFSVSENKQIISFAEDFFSTQFAGYSDHKEINASLFQML
jgi:HD superfamily phosphohydrolase